MKEKIRRLFFNVWTIPNILTMIRLILIPVFVVLFVNGQEKASLAVFAVASITDMFDGMLALSGIYTASYGFGDYMDEVVYRNSVVDYLGGMPADHPFIQQYNSHRGIICVGQGPWEMPESTRQVANICRDKGIQVWVDFWGYDCAHDWDWWYKQVRYFLPILLQD